MDNCITKAGKVGSSSATPVAMAKINAYAIKELAPEDVFVFKMVVCDNEIDRDFEVFPRKSLDAMAGLLVGKTIISNHQAKAENQCARVFDTEVTESGMSSTGEPYSALVAHCYTVRTDRNRDFITEIEAGIKKEVSVSCSIGAVVCSVCGADNRKVLCKHWPGREYDGAKCHMKLESPLDGYEISFVAIPAQPKAGVAKSYGGAEQKEPVHDEAVALDCELAATFIFTQKEKENAK